MQRLDRIDHVNIFMAYLNRMTAEDVARINNAVQHATFPGYGPVLMYELTKGA